MRTVIVFLVAVFVSISVFAQNTLELVKSLNEARKSELELVISRADDISNPGKKEKFVKKETKTVNERYDRLIAQALKGEKNEKKQEESSNKRRIAGANVNFEGEGKFSGKSLSIEKGADVYATVVTADANAYLTKKVADGLNTNSSAISAPNSNIGLEGVVVNKYKYQEAQITITGYNKGNSYRKSIFLGRGQSKKEYLLPGLYSVTITANGRTSNLEDIAVRPNQTHDYMGSPVFWFIAGGQEY